MKIGFFITARLKSSRLKHKILLDLNGKPIIQRVIERCKSTMGIDNVVICTSTNPQDSILYDYALKNKIQFWAGSEDDVLYRLLSAAEYYGYDAFLSITADNPLFSILTSQIVIDWFRQESFDFIFTKGLPVGVSTYFIKTKALQIANFMKQETDTEIWGPFVNRADFFKIGELKITNSPFKEDKRITCDYPEDYRFINMIYNYYAADDIPRIQSYFQILKNKPELWKINGMHTQRILDENILQNINKIFDKNIEKGKNFAKVLNIVLSPGRKTLTIEI